MTSCCVEHRLELADQVSRQDDQYTVTVIQYRVYQCDHQHLRCEGRHWTADLTKSTWWAKTPWYSMFDVCPHWQITVSVDAQVASWPHRSGWRSSRQSTVVKLAAGVGAELLHTTQLLSYLDSAEACWISWGSRCFNALRYVRRECVAAPYSWVSSADIIAQPDITIHMHCFCPWAAKLRQWWIHGGAMGRSPLLGASKFKVGHVTLTTPLLRVICHLYAGTWHRLHACKIWPLCLQPFWRYGWCPSKFNWFTWPDHAPFRGSLSSMGWHLLQSTYLPNLTSLSQPTTTTRKAIQIAKMGWFGVVRGHTRSLEMAPFDIAHTISC